MRWGSTRGRGAIIASRSPPHSLPANSRSTSWLPMLFRWSVLGPVGASCAAHEQHGVRFHLRRRHRNPRNGRPRGGGRLDELWCWGGRGRTSSAERAGSRSTASWWTVSANERRRDLGSGDIARWPTRAAVNPFASSTGSWRKDKADGSASILAVVNGLRTFLLLEPAYDVAINMWARRGLGHGRDLRRLRRSCSGELPEGRHDAGGRLDRPGQGLSEAEVAMERDETVVAG